MRSSPGHDRHGPRRFRRELDGTWFEDGDLPCLLCGGVTFTRPFPLEHPWMRACVACGLAAAVPQPEESELAAIYDEHYFDEWGPRDPQGPLARVKKRTYARLLALLGRAGGLEPGPLLDVGCGLGYSLDVARSMGFVAHGLEPHAASAAEVEVRHPGRVLIGTAEVAELPRGRFAGITLVDLIEHLRDPLAVLRRLRSALVPGGRLLVVTNDRGSWRARRLGPRWFHIHRAHLFYFDRRTLSALVQRAGYEVLEVTVPRKDFNLRYIAGILIAKPNWPLAVLAARLLLSVLPRFLLDLPLPPLAEGIAVLARRSDRAAADGTSHEVP